MKKSFFLPVIIFFLIVLSYSGYSSPFFPLSTQNSLNITPTEQQINSWINSYRGIEPNSGQVGSLEGKRVDNILFSVKERGFTLFFKTDGISYVIYQSKSNPEVAGNNREKINAEQREMQYARIDLELLNGRIEKRNIIYQEPLPGYSNYYLGHCPEEILNVISYREVVIKEVYPGIDWVFRYDERGELHHEFIVGAGADVSQIKYRVKWADVKVSSDGREIVFSTPIGEIKDGAINSYSGIRGVDVKYSIQENIISYEVMNWDREEPLIIDPPLALKWATYYGGGGNSDYGSSITTDGSGNVFVTGETYSTNFPVYNPGGGAYFQGTFGGGGFYPHDAFILKFNNNGVRLWATYYGGNGDEWGTITTDGSGNVFVTGETYSTNFPVYDPGGGAYFQGTGAGNWDAFILKFNNNGVRLWATYYGGSGWDEGESINIDGSGNVFVTGRTESTNFPVYNPGGGTYFQGTFGGGSYYDAFILKFNNNGVRLWATYYGGSDNDQGYSITTDVSGNVFVTGETGSTNFPVYNPGGGTYFQGTFGGGSYYDAFILKFNNNGVRLWATYYGGSDNDQGYSITTDGSGNVFVTGETYSTNFPVYNPGGGAYFQGTGGGSYYDAFILKFNNNGVRLWATYYGGSDNDQGYSITTDVSGNVFVTGYTYSRNFPVYNPGGGAYFQGTHGGGSWDAFILKFNNNGVRFWATYYGGSDNDQGYSITTDGSGNVFVTGWTVSTNFPVYNPGGGAYFQGTGGGTYSDAFILKFEGEQVVGIQPVGNKLPSSFALKQNYPNPFNPVTNIEFDIPKTSYVKLIVYDIIGREITTLVNENLPAGSYRVQFDGSNLTSGVYYYRLTAGDYTETKKMTLIK